MRQNIFTTKLLAIFSLLIWSVASTAQVEFPSLAIGQWSQHLPWQRAVSVTQSDSKVYYATEWAVLELDKADRSAQFLTKVEGLSDVGMNFIRFNKPAGVLLLAYSNSNIDLWRASDRTVVNLPFIQKNVNISGDKKIYDAVFEGKTAYLACGFGILKMNMETAEVEYTVFTGVPIYAVAVFQNNLYAGTEEGIYRLPVDDINPADFSRWHLLGQTEGFPQGNSFNCLTAANGVLFLGIENALCRFDGAVFDTITVNPSKKVIFQSAEGAGLVIGWRKDENDYNGRIQYLEPGSSSPYDINFACESFVPRYAVEDGSNKFWIADSNDDFRFYDPVSGACDRFRFNSPYNESCFEIAVARNKVYVAPPAYDVNLNANYFPYGIYMLDTDGQWKRFYGESNPELKGGDCDKSMWRVAPHASEDKFYVGSFVGGLIEATNSGAETKCYNQNNSILQNAGASGANRTAISGLAHDDAGNLWISNYDAAAPIAVLKKDGTLRNFSASPTNNLMQVAVDRNGYKWFVVAFNGGVLVYDSGQDIDSPGDDRYRLITSSNSVMPTNNVNCIAVDLEGDVWIGTQQGTVSFECGSNVFDAACKGSRRIVNVDGFNGYLFENEEIRTIAVDGANRKWFGTATGVFVQSASGETQEAHFSSTNSPLFDNTINDIAINHLTGEVWIGTAKGLISYRGEATQGNKINSSSAYAYPNPVQPGYDGPIAIYGLARDANVKITDVSGQLVYEGKALGGQAVWDGRDYLGRRAASGVYLVFATSSESFDSPDAIITKVVILN